MTSDARIHLTLNAPDITTLHRGGMAGLWMTLKQLETLFPSSNSRPGNLSWLLTSRSISLDWQGEDFVVLDWLLKQSFQINEQGLISLTGLNPSSISLINQIHIHQAIQATFLRLSKFYRAGKQISQTCTINGTQGVIKYKTLQWYANQTFAEKLCDETGQLLTDKIPIVSWLYLGATVRHARLGKHNKLVEKPEYALALLFLPVICKYFILHSDGFKIDEQQLRKYLIVIPEVNNLKLTAQRCWNLASLDYQDLHVTSLGEAALKYYSQDNLGLQDNYQEQCQVWLYEKWDKKSRQRTLFEIQEIEIKTTKIETYQLVYQHFQKNKIFRYKNGFTVKINPILGLIADNLAQERPWWSNFWQMIYERDTLGELAKQLNYNRKGLITMLEHDQELEAYQDLIRAFHEALRIIYRKIYDKTKKGEIPRIEREYERIRGGLSRCYNEQSFADFLSNFLARAGLNSSLYNHWESILPLMVDEVSWEKTRNIALIALASYKPSEKPTDGSQENTPVMSEA